MYNYEDSDLTNNDIRMIQYFWLEKGDLERWAQFEERWPVIQRELPMIARLWNDYKFIIQLLDGYIKALPDV